MANDERWEDWSGQWPGRLRTRVVALRGRCAPWVVALLRETGAAALDLNPAVALRTDEMSSQQSSVLQLLARHPAA